MPWKIEDVESHKKGLTDDQKAVWVRVANAALAACQARGGSDCEASAIRQANSVAAKNMTEDEVVAAIKAYADHQTFNIHGVEIFATGKWNGDKYEEKDLDEMVAAFNQVGFEPPLKLGHNSAQEKELYKDGQPAFGYIAAIRRAGGKLLADFKDIPQKVYEAMKRKNYQRVSAEIYWNYSSNGRSFPRVLKAVALLGADIPAVTSLEAIGNLYDSTGHDFRVYEFNAKKEDDMSEERIRELESKVAQLSEETNTAKSAAAEATAKLAAAEEAKAAAEKHLAEQAATARAEKIDAFIAAEKKAGRVVPAIEAEVRALLTSASDAKVYTAAEEGKTVELSQLDTLTRLIGKLPKQVEFTERGTGAEPPADREYTTTAGEEVDRRVKEYMAKNTTVKDYGEGLAAVLAADADLKSAYAAETIGR